MQARLRIALILTVALALPALLAAAPAPAPPAPAGAAAAACAPASSAAGGLFAPQAATATASPIQMPWGGTIPAATCDCSGYDCGAGCYPYQCVVLFGGRCGAICKCSP